MLVSLIHMKNSSGNTVLASYSKRKVNETHCLNLIFLSILRLQMKGIWEYIWGAGTRKGRKVIFA